MSALLHWFTSPEWSLAVRALLHTLWQGAIVAIALGLLLRRMRSPALRYRCSLAALAGVLLAGIVTWSILNRPLAPVETANNPPPVTASNNALTVADDLPPIVVTGTLERVKPTSPQWTAWIALAWLAGSILMLGRAGIQVAGAERLRRSTRPLDDSRIAQLLAEAQRTVQLTRKIRVAVTDTLTSPAVVGVLIPTLILPLSLITTLSQEQLRFVLLHELAHIRRGDYFANLFQLFTEALLFFNPAVWWISHQVRREREACCDALAIELSGAPVDYAKTLVHVAEHSLSPAPVAATAFGDEREPSSLTDRVQRLLVPGYRPKLRLTWRAMLAALLAGGTLLVLSAVGTRLTMAAILSPQQRMEQIEKKMTEYGSPPIAESASDPDSPDAPKAEISGQVRMADGSPLPKINWINFYHSRKHSSGVSGGRLNNDGTYSTTVRFGLFRAALVLPGYAPALSRAVDVNSTNAVGGVDVLVSPGFDKAIQLTDATTGQAIANSAVKAQFWVPNMGTSIGSAVMLTTDAHGMATLEHCSDSVALTLVANALGYEIVDQRFEQLRPKETLQLRLRPGAMVSGVVLNKDNNRPIAGATVRLIYEKGATERRYEWTDNMAVLATTDANGRFTVNQLRSNTRYWLGVSAPGRESVITPPLTASAGEQKVLLGQELIVRGRVTGNLDQLQRIDKDRCLSRNFSEVFDNHSNGWQEWVRLRVTNGVGYFQFTNRTPGKVTLSGKGYREEREITGPIDDWVVDLGNVESTDAEALPKREVIFRFTHPSGIPPRGTVSVTIPTNLDRKNLTAQNVEMQITNSEVRVDVAIGGQTRIEPKRTVGYWFKAVDYFFVTNGVGPMVVEIPCIPAGAIYAQARNADGTPAGGLLFGLRELKPAPERKDMGTLDSGGDSSSGNAPRKWVSGPLPLGGTYQVHAWRGNSFCLSQPIKLTEAGPDAEVELQFPPGETFVGRVLDSDGSPIPNALLELTFTLPNPNNHSFGLKPVASDETGSFQIENTTPGIGDYFVQVNAPRQMAGRVKLDFGAQPQTIRLKRGYTLGGRVIQADTGFVIPNTEVRASDFGSFKLPMLKTQTDADGYFEFTSLGDAEYRFFVEAGQMLDNKQYRPDGSTNLTLTVKLYDWSKAKPKPPASTTKTPIIPASASVHQATRLLENNNTNLFTRTFRVDTHAFHRALVERAGLKASTNPTNVFQNIHALLADIGVDLQPPKNIFYGDRKGMLLVRATLKDLDAIEQLLQVINDTPPQINIKVKFVEMPEESVSTFYAEWFGTNRPSASSWSGIMTRQQYSKAIQSFENRMDTEIITGPEVTALSGRQAQIQMVEVRTIVNGLTTTTTNGGTQVDYKTSPMPFGPVLDVIPYVSSDGYTIQLTAIPTVNEFLGYDDPGISLQEVIGKKEVWGHGLPLPRFRVRQITTTANVWDGQTLVLGNFSDQTVVNRPDGTSNTNSFSGEIKKQLFVFITPTLIDPAGNRINKEEDIPAARNSIPPLNSPRSNR